MPGLTVTLTTEKTGETQSWKFESGLRDYLMQSLAADPGLAYERFAWRMRRDLYPDATTLILQRSTSAAAL